MKWLFCFSVLCFVFACENNVTNKAAIDTTENSNKNGSDTTAALKQEQETADKTQYFIWNVDAVKKTITKNPQLQPHYYNVDTLIAGLNEKYPQIRLEKKSVGHDTLYTEIKDAQYLTEQMGDAGSEQYIAQAVLNLTAVSGIRYVRIEFAPGSHAEPDVWSKNMFSDYKEVNQ